MSKPVNATLENFDAEVLNSELPVMVDFYADWCPPCRMLAPILDILATEFDGRLKIVKINSDEERHLATAYNVTGLPTVIFMDGGHTVGRFAGLPREDELRNELRNWLTSKAVA